MRQVRYQDKTGNRLLPAAVVDAWKRHQGAMFSPASVRFAMKRHRENLLACLDFDEIDWLDAPDEADPYAECDGCGNSGPLNTCSCQTEEQYEREQDRLHGGCQP